MIFNGSFAVSPDTFNMNVYQRLPYDPAFLESFVNQGDGTTGYGGVDLGGAGLVGVGAAIVYLVVMMVLQVVQMLLLQQLLMMIIIL